jgi:uncharacterized heparinase superfamily protein
MASTADQARLIGFVVSSGVRRAFARLGNLFAGGLPFDGRAPSRLLIAPHDLRTADPTIANDIYRGRFSLSGTAVQIGSVSPFLVDPPSRGWQEELLGFSWLRHLHAASDPVSRVHARALISDWIALQGSGHPIGWQPHIMARRIISWLAHSPLYLANAEPELYRAVMRSLGRQLRHLARHQHRAPDGLPRLTSLIAMSYATLCTSGLERLQVRAVRQLVLELDRQVLPDGGHISRNPAAILELLLDLLPLRQTFLSRDLAPPQAVISAIDRMMPMVRFFRHGDGGFALFNGVGRSQLGAISAALAYDDSRGRPPDQAPHSGYQRIEAGRALLIMDTGRAPPTSVSHQAHAGCLSFEFSSGTDRIITNCGSSAAMRDEWRQAARTTAAHSTVVVDNTSSCRFLATSPLAAMFGTPIIAGPRSIQLERSQSEQETTVQARHDGYRRRGILHTRHITLTRDGLDLEGIDRLTRTRGLFSRTRSFAVRFHLHPNVGAALSSDGRAARLLLPGGEAWRFSVLGTSLRLEESVYLADSKGVRRSEQLVINGQCGADTSIRWALRREGGTRAPRVRQLVEGEPEERVLPQTVDPTGDRLGGSGGDAGTGEERLRPPRRTGGSSPPPRPAGPATVAGPTDEEPEAEADSDFFDDRDIDETGAPIDPPPPVDPDAERDRRIGRFFRRRAAPPPGQTPPEAAAPGDDPKAGEPESGGTKAGGTRHGGPKNGEKPDR